MDDIMVVSTGNALPAFQTLTIADYVANFEDYQSELIELDSVTITSGNWPSSGSNGGVTISDGTGETTLYVDKDTDCDENSAPTGPFNLRGIGTRYNSTPEINPRFYSDILPLGSIIEARTHASGETVTVSGVITTPNYGSLGYSEYDLQDATAGCVIFSSTFDAGFSVGDSVTVTGAVSIYSGAFEVVPTSPASITTVSTGNALPMIQPITAAVLMAMPEDYESELIILDSVTILGGNWPSSGSNGYITVTDPSGVNTTLVVDKETDLDENTAPLGYFTLTGVGVNYNGTGEIKPRYYSDIQTIGDPPPAITNVANFPASPNPSDDVLVTATIVDNGSVASATLVYTVDGGSENDVTMTADGSTNSATIPAQAASAVVSYWVTATDDIGGTSSSMPASYVVYSGTVNAIADIQNGTIPTGTTVTIQGIVTAESWAFGTPGSPTHFYIQDDETPYSGVKVYQSGVEVAQGDEVRLTGVVSEYYDCTEITDLDTMEILSHNHTMAPMVVPMTTTDWEPYEGCLIQVQNVTVASEMDNNGEWTVTDGNGNNLICDNDARYYYYPAQDEALASITGVVDYSFSAYKLEPRLTNDIVTADGITSIQAVQQVRYSDLFPYEEVDGNLHVSDSSYFTGDTVTLRGVVTMPTGLSFAGNGVKFNFEDPHGGPWSGIMSYSPDSSHFPVLYEGDYIQVTGYVGEYTTDRSSMTEFWVTSDVQFVDGDWPPVPERSVVATGDLRWPTTAEQWGTVMVTVENATVTDDVPIYELFAVDDGSGSVLVDDDSDSLVGFVVPPAGTEYSSISGWVYNHYGYYEDSTAYKLEPLYNTWLVLNDAIGNESVVPQGFALANYPNPTTTINFRIPEASSVKLIVYDGLGRMVKVLANSQMNAGEYKVAWDGTNTAGKKVASGIYLYRLVAGQKAMVGKMVMLK